MGWWNYGILDGDEPMDCLYDIEETLGLNHDKDSLYSKKEPDPAIAYLLTNKQDALVNDGSLEEPVYLQVVAYVMMQHGATMTNENKQLFLQACDADARRFKNQLERAKVIANFRTAIENYNGTPVALTKKGLFETLGEHMQNGDEGLINK